MISIGIAGYLSSGLIRVVGKLFDALAAAVLTDAGAHHARRCRPQRVHHARGRRASARASVIGPCASSSCSRIARSLWKPEKLTVLIGPSGCGKSTLINCSRRLRSGGFGARYAARQAGERSRSRSPGRVPGDRTVPVDDDGTPTSPTGRSSSASDRHDAESGRMRWRCSRLSGSLEFKDKYPISSPVACSGAQSSRGR